MQNACYTKNFEELLKQLRSSHSSFIMCITSNSDSMAETTGLGIEV